MKNLDLFANEVEVPDPPRGRRKTLTLQEMYGVTEGRTCGECVHCYGYRQSRVWYKCELWLNRKTARNPLSLDMGLRAAPGITDSQNSSRES